MSLGDIKAGGRDCAVAGEQKAEGRKQKALLLLRSAPNPPHESHQQQSFAFPFCLLPTAYCLLPTAFCLLPCAYCLLLTTYCLLLTAYCLLPSAFCLLPSA